MADISVVLTLDDRQFQQTIKSVESKVDKFGSSFERSVKANTKSIDSMRSSLGNIEKNLGKISDSAKTNIGNTTKLFDNLKATIAGISFGALIVDVARLSTEIVSTAKSLNISTAAAVGFQKAVAAAGGDADNARDALISLSQKLGEAKTQGGDALDAFNELGISLTDIANLSTEEMIKKTVDALGTMTDATRQADIQNRIFGEDIKNTDFKQLSAGLNQYVEAAKKVSPAMEAARKAQLDYNNTYASFQDEIVKAVPWEELSSGIKTISDNMEYIGNVFRAAVHTIKDLGGAVLWLGGSFAALKGLKIAERLFDSFRLSGNSLLKMLYKLKFDSNALGKFADGITSIADHGSEIKQLQKDMGVLFTKGSLVELFFSNLGGSLLKIIPFIGQVIGAFQLFDFVIESITGKDLAGWFATLYNTIVNSAVVESIENQIAALSKLMGIEYESEASKSRRSERMRNAAKESLKQLEDEQKKAKEKAILDDNANKTLAEKSKLIQTTINDVNQMTAAYSQSIQQQQKNIKSQIDMIGVAEDYKAAQQELLELDNTRLSKIQELQNKIDEANGKPEIQEEYRKGIAKINEEYQKEIGNVEALSSQLLDRNRNARLGLLTEQYRVSTTKEYHDMVANRILPTLDEEARAYYEIEKAASDALTAEIEREAQLRGVKPSELPTDVYDKISKSVNQNKDAKLEEAKATIAQRREENLLNVQYQDTLNSIDEITKMNRELAYDILPWQEREQQKLIDGAKERAQAEIDAENARRGVRGENAMSLAEAKKYSDAMVANAQMVAAARIKSMNETRTFAYGWKSAMQSYVEEAGNAAKKASAIFEKMMSGMEDLIVNFVKTGKFEWKNFLAMMLEELLRAQIQAVFASMIGDMTGALKGSSGGGILGGLIGGLGKLLGISGGDNKQNNTTDGSSGSSGGILGGLIGGLGKLLGISGGDNKQNNTTDGSQNNTNQDGSTNSLWTGIKDLGGKFWNGLKGIGSDILDGLDGLGSWLGDIGGSILDGLGSLGTGILDGLGGIGSWLGDALGGLGSLFAGFFATGGKIPEGQFGMVAEKGPEIVNGKLYTKPTLVAGPAEVVPFEQNNAPIGTGAWIDGQGKIHYSTNIKDNPYGNSNIDTGNTGNWSIGNVMSLIASGKIKNNRGSITMNGESVPTNAGRTDYSWKYNGNPGKIPPGLAESQSILESWLPLLKGGTSGVASAEYEKMKADMLAYKNINAAIDAKKSLLSKNPYAIMPDVEKMKKNTSDLKASIIGHGDKLKNLPLWTIMPAGDVIPNAPNGFYASWWLNDKLGGKPELKSKLPDALQNGLISQLFKYQGVERFDEDQINSVFGINQYIDAMMQTADATMVKSNKFTGEYDSKIKTYEEKLAAMKKAQEEAMWNARKDSQGFSWSKAIGMIGSMFGGWGTLGALAVNAGGKYAGLFANGGQIPKGYWGIAGEAGPEIVHGPATVTPMKDNSGTNITYNINAVDAMSFKQMLAKDPSFVHGVVMQGAKGIPMR